MTTTELNEKWSNVYDFGHHGIYDNPDCLYESTRELLKESLESGLDFDTGGHGFKHELEGMRIYAYGDEITVEVGAYMDDLEDLIYMDIELADELTEEEQECLFDNWYDCLDVQTEFNESMDISRNSSVEDIIKCATKLIHKCNANLEYSFDWLNQQAKLIHEFYQKRG